MNVVYILSDRHNPEFSGCYGNPVTRTPNMDRMAESGARFESAYCVSPICVPTRAAMITGRYVHEIGAWDNTSPYAGVPEGWGRTFAEQGVSFTTIGKLDFQPGADHGIEDERLPTHREHLDVLALYREDDLVPRTQYLSRIREAGPADPCTGYQGDARVAEEAARWLSEDRPRDRPWVLAVNFSNLHRWAPFRDLWDHYDPLVKLEDLDERYTEDLDHMHPFHRAFARYSNAEYVLPEEMRRGIVGYHGACEILDTRIGRVLQALDDTGLRDDVLLVYAADHSGNCGEHRMEDHGGLYEESIHVPLLFSGPGIRSGHVESSVVSMLDVYPTICEAVGMDLPVHMRGTSLLGLLRGEKGASAPDFALTEYHADGFPGSGFAVRSGPYKYAECVGERPMLFNLAEDPREMHDLVVENPDGPDVKAAIRRLRGQLYQICCPEAVDARAKADQRVHRERLKKTGRLVDELWRRGFERNPDRLILREEFMPS